MNCHVELPSGPNEKHEISDREDYVGDESILSSYEQYTGGAERDEKNKEESKEKHKNVVSIKLFFVSLLFYLNIFPVTGILAFLPPGLGSYSMRVTASYSYEGLVASALFITHLSHYTIRMSSIQIKPICG